MRAGCSQEQVCPGAAEHGGAETGPELGLGSSEEPYLIASLIPWKLLGKAIGRKGEGC